MPTTIDNLLSRMTLKEKIGQMILASIEVSRMDAGTREFLRKNHIGNVILFGKNCAGRAALAQLNAEIQHTVMAENGLPALIAIDQDGRLCYPPAQRSHGFSQRHGHCPHGRSRQRLQSWAHDGR